MKKIFFLVILFLFSLSACASSPEEKLYRELNRSSGWSCQNNICENTLSPPSRGEPVITFDKNHATFSFEVHREDLFGIRVESYKYNLRTNLIHININYYGDAITAVYNGVNSSFNSYSGLSSRRDIIQRESNDIWWYVGTVLAQSGVNRFDF
jgi:hypothetical protein